MKEDISSAFEHYLLFIVCKVVAAAIKCCVSDLCVYDLFFTFIFLSSGMEKGVKHNQDQSTIMLLLEHNFRHSAVVLRVRLKSILPKFLSIMYLTLLRTRKAPLKTLTSGINCETHDFIGHRAITKYTI